jgi:hypothetical protein
MASVADTKSVSFSPKHSPHKKQEENVDFDELLNEQET